MSPWIQAFARSKLNRLKQNKLGKTIKLILSWKLHYELGNIALNLETSVLTWKHLD